MTPRLLDYLEHINQAARDACEFVEGMDLEGFRSDRRTQQAVVMSLVVIGEAAARVMDRYPEFVANNPGIPWQSMRGMRNRIAHGYFDINLTLVWATVQTALPKLLAEMPDIISAAHASQEPSS